MGMLSAHGRQTAGAHGDPFAPVVALLEEAIAEGAFPGATFAVMLGGEMLAVRAAGHFTYAPDSPLVEPDTCYDLASVSKVIATTAMAMLLWQRGLLELEAPLADILPGFLLAGKAAGRTAGEAPASLGRARRKVTLRMLLAHSSGLPGYAPFFETCTTPVQVMQAALALPLDAPPGTIVAYSDPGFILLGKALEVLAAESLECFFRSDVQQPLGLAGTRYRPAPAARMLIPPTEIDAAFRHQVIQGVVHDENCFVLGGVSGHAGLFAPAEDVACFGEALLAPLRRPGEADAAPRLFTREAVELFTRRVGEPAGSSRALGWDTPSGEPSSAGTRFSPRAFGHLGYTGTSLWLDPERDLAVSLLTNRTFPTRENRKIQVFRPLFHDAVVAAVESEQK